jgi:hypothetical protein
VFEPEVTEKALRLYRAENGDPNEVKVSGQLATLPWFEERGPNPYLMLTGQARSGPSRAASADCPGTRGISSNGSAPGPGAAGALVKVLMPVILLQPWCDALRAFYFLLVLLFTLATWSFFARHHAHRQRRGGPQREDWPVRGARFTCNRWLHYLSALTLPLALVAVLLVVLWLFGLVHMIPGVGDLLDGLLWGYRW